MYVLSKFILFCVLFFFITTSAYAQPYQILKQDDYEKVTGCQNLSNYQRSMQVALNYLVFAKDHVDDDELTIAFKELEYARRHTRDFFNESVARNCIHPTIKRIGLELYQIDAKDKAIRNGIDSNSANKLEDVMLKKLIVTSNKVPIYEILPRSEFNKTTGCLVSPKTYHYYHKAFFARVLGWYDYEKAQGFMKTFLQEMGEGAQENGFVRANCMIPAIKILADELELLDGRKRFKLKN